MVIGGGWGGLSTGALLSRRGLRVLVAESGSSAGGRASYREREGFLLDYGIHGHRFGKDGPAARLYKELGEKLDMVEPGPGVIYHKGKMHPIDSGRVAMARTRVFSNKAKAAAGVALGKMLINKPDRNYRRPVSELLPENLSEDARFVVSFISGLGLISTNLEETSAGELIYFLKKVARGGQSVSFPRGGCKQHVERLGAAVRENGELRTGFRVNGVLVEKGAASGVSTGEGDFRARSVVAAVPLPQVPALLPEGLLPADLRDRMESIHPTAGISWDIALRKPITDVCSVFSTDPLIMGSFISNFDTEISPPGKQFSTYCMPLPLSTFRTPERFKREENKLRSTVMDMFPGMEENVEWERMLRMPVIDGAIPTVDQPWPTRPSPAGSKVPGLFLAGDSVGVPGQGGDIAFESAVECAREVVSYLEG